MRAISDVNWDDLRHRLLSLRDDDFFPVASLLNQLGKVRFRLVNGVRFYIS